MGAMHGICSNSSGAGAAGYLLLAVAAAGLAFSAAQAGSLRVYRDSDGICQRLPTATDLTRIEIRIRNQYWIWVSCTESGKH